MDNRKAARQARIDEVLFHKDITDLSEELEKLRQIRDNVSVFFMLNVDHALSIMDLDFLRTQGWKMLDYAHDTERVYSWKMSKKTDEVFLHLSADREWLSLQLGNSNPEQERQYSEKEKNELEQTLLPAILEAGPQNLEEEHQYCLAHCPPLYTATGKRVDPEKEYLESLWERIVRDLIDNQKRNKVRAHIFSMLRHLTEPDPNFVWLALPLSAFERYVASDALKATICLLLLEHTPDGCICTHYHAITNLLHEFGFHQSAMYCANVTWLYTQKPDILDFSEMQRYSEFAIAQLISENRLEDIPKILKAVNYCLEKLPSPRFAASIAYLRGLLATKERLWNNAEMYFQQTLQTLHEIDEEEQQCHSVKVFQNAVSLCLDRAVRNMKKKRKTTDDFFKTRLEFYPVIPG